MKIGIELNGILRDINAQVLKYYEKDINKEFDSSELESNILLEDLMKKLPWKSKKAMKTFQFEDYPYELYGCAQSMISGLVGILNTWMLEHEDVEICLFSANESDLTIQSSYFFLAKTGCRVREVYFPINILEMWDKCDVLITNNKKLMKNKPKGKIVVRIKTKDHRPQGHGDMTYNTLLEVLEDKDFITSLQGIQDSKSFIKTFFKQVKEAFKTDKITTTN